MTRGDCSGDSQWFESEAELLVNYQLDLIAQLESQLRAIHHTMRHIEKLRGAKHRVGPKLSNLQRGDTLLHLSEDLSSLDGQLSLQHQSCQHMQEIIEAMQMRLRELRQRAAAIQSNRSPEANSPGK